MKFTFIDLAPVEYEVLTNILAEDHVRFTTKMGPDYDNDIFQPGYNVTINKSYENIQFIQYMFKKRIEPYEKFGKMIEISTSETTVNDYIKLNEHEHTGGQIHEK